MLRRSSARLSCGCWTSSASAYHAGCFPFPAVSETVIEPAADANDLNRFLVAQADTYADALAEVRAGRKLTHWMWFVFPQLRGLGSSNKATFYGLDGVDEAGRYLEHPVLGARLREICAAAAAVEGATATEVFGEPDDAKLRSCATLYARVADDGAVFDAVLARFFGSEGCAKTAEKLS